MQRSLHRSPNYRSLILEPSSRGHIAAAILQIGHGVVGLGKNMEACRSKSAPLTKTESREAKSRRQRERQVSLSIGMAAAGRLSEIGLDGLGPDNDVGSVVRLLGCLSRCGGAISDSPFVSP